MREGDVLEYGDGASPGGPNEKTPNDETDDPLGYTEREAHERQAQEPYDQLDADTHREQPGGRRGSCSRNQILEPAVRI